MTDHVERSSPRLKARLAGFLYLLVMIATGFDIFVLSKLIAPGDAAATAHNILASAQLFRHGFAADLIAGPCYIGVTLLLYELLRPVNRSVSLLAAFLSLVATGIGGANMVNLMAPLILLGDAPYLTAFTPDQLQALALAFLKLHTIGYQISVVFFAFYMILLGGLIVRSALYASNHWRSAGDRECVRPDLQLRDFPCPRLRSPSLPRHSGARHPR